MVRLMLGVLHGSIRFSNWLSWIAFRLTAQIVEWELVGGSFGETFVEMFSANGYVAIVTADLDLFTFSYRASGGVDA